MIIRWHYKHFLRDQKNSVIQIDDEQVAKYISIHTLTGHLAKSKHTDYDGVNDISLNVPFIVVMAGCKTRARPKLLKTKIKNAALRSLPFCSFFLFATFRYWSFFTQIIMILIIWHNYFKMVCKGFTKWIHASTCLTQYAKTSFKWSRHRTDPRFNPRSSFVNSLTG